METTPGLPGALEGLHRALTPCPHLNRQSRVEQTPLTSKQAEKADNKRRKKTNEIHLINCNEIKLIVNKQN